MMSLKGQFKTGGCRKSDDLQRKRRIAIQTTDKCGDGRELKNCSTQKTMILKLPDGVSVKLQNFNSFLIDYPLEGSSMASDNETGPSTSTGRQSGVSEYRNAMDSIKRRNAPTQPSAPLRYTENVPALVPEELANEVWLEDDLRPNAPKRRRSPDINRPESASRVKRTRQ
jgi:hypothetical protein